MLEIKNLKVKVKNNDIIKGIDIFLKKGEIHVIMGPNGSGKSTLSNVITGKNGYEIEGSISYKNEDLLKKSIDERAVLGIYQAFQYPIEIPGVNSLNFIKQSLNAIRKRKNQKPLDSIEFKNLIKEKQLELGIDDSFLKRDINVGFSGGEKKKFDILHMSILNPELIILDEIDSGLDIDALKSVAEGINKIKNGKTILIITHYQRLLNYIKPDIVHIMKDGKIVLTGGREIVNILEKEGYKSFEKTTL
ncbi:MAG: Fe-S cluster assembly ATPase SufC [Chlamydiae bacterium RIFCSPHIGHO2_12_FULL_27_8]|nr:MAG: Fe-S cluster assembly ATPase SufC [Chlamydiae bacterium RIFCSPHIGHO2_12_FULL_27_8]